MVALKLRISTIASGIIFLKQERRGGIETGVGGTATIRCAGSRNAVVALKRESAPGSGDMPEPKQERRGGIETRVSRADPNCRI